MNLAKLQETFGIAGVLAFRQHGELVCAEIHVPACTAVLYLQGAHLTEWTPTGHDPVLFLSPESEFATGKAIRGGVPIVFPWFGPRTDGGAGPSHGFARTAVWQLEFAALMGDELRMMLTLGPNEESRRLGWDGFALAYELRLGASLTLRLTVANHGAEAMRFEEALHTYFAVGDVRSAEVTGLEDVSYLDKVQDGRKIDAAKRTLVLEGPTDRVYEATQGECVITDRVGGRRIRNQKRNSMTTVVWNPWKAMADLGEAAWPRMLCVETANTGAEAVTIAPGEAHTMEAVIAVDTSEAKAGAA